MKDRGAAKTSPSSIPESKALDSKDFSSSLSDIPKNEAADCKVSGLVILNAFSEPIPIKSRVP
jgi:hypothetical protein